MRKSISMKKKMILKSAPLTKDIYMHMCACACIQAWVLCPPHTHQTHYPLFPDSALSSETSASLSRQEGRGGRREEATYSINC